MKFSPQTVNRIFAGAALAVSLLAGVYVANIETAAPRPGQHPWVKFGGKSYPTVELDNAYPHPGLIAITDNRVDVDAASCRVSVTHRECGNQGCKLVTNWGTGTLIAPGKILTCSHLYDEGGIDTVAYFNGQPYKAALLKRSVTHDLALLSVEGVNVTPTEYVGEIDKAKPFTLCGFGAGDYLRSSGTFARWTAADKAGRYSLQLHGVSRDGDSGGGVFNEYGQLVGVRWGKSKVGETPTYVYATAGPPLVNFLWGK